MHCRLYCPAVREMRLSERFTIMKHCTEYLTHTHTHRRGLRIAVYTLICHTLPHMQAHSALSEVSIGQAYLGQGRALGPVRRGKPAIGPPLRLTLRRFTRLGWNPIARQLPRRSRKQVSRRTQWQAWNQPGNCLYPSVNSPLLSFGMSIKS